MRLARGWQRRGTPSQATAYGTSTSTGLYASFGACISRAQHLTPQQRQNLLSAEKTCRGEQLANKSAFDTKYGTNATSGKHATAPTSGSKSNAFGKCVSMHNHA